MGQNRTQSALAARREATRRRPTDRRRRRFTMISSAVLVSVLALGAIVTVVDATPSGATGIAYVGRVASATGTVSARGTTAVLTVSSAGVQSGDAVLGSALFGSTTSLTGPVTITDAAGDAYHVDRDVNDGTSKDRMIAFSTIATAPLAAGSAIRFTFPASTNYHINADEFSGVGVAEVGGAAATGTATTWSSGTATAAQAGDLFFGAVGNESGNAPTWAAGWTTLPILTIGKDHLGAGYRIASATGGVAATGATTGTWMAGLTAYRAAGPPVDAPPVARLSVTPTSGTAPLIVTANASASTDSDATPIASYTFDFGDGTTPTTQAAASLGHTYTTVGNYTITVTVTDTANLTGTATAPVTVNPTPPDAPPVARLSVTPTSGTAPLIVTANASASTDTDATPIASYTFDFGDGTTATTQAAASLGHTYTTVGNYTITVTVTDTANLTGTATAPVTVNAATGPPIRVSVGYYDTHHPGLPQPKPNPWMGSAGVMFVGTPDTSSGGWDTSAVKVENLTNAPITGVSVSVKIGSSTYALWGTNSIPVGSSLILAQTGFENFDGSDHHAAGRPGGDPKLCNTAVDRSVPTITIRIGGTSTTYHDTALLLSTGGVDRAGCPYTGKRNDESEPWQVVPN